jgi:RNA polymerase sigma factor (sigma-70 family)
MDKATQEKIIHAILTGQGDKVLSVLYEEILPKIKGMILKNSGDEDEVKDVFQDAVVVLYKQVRKGSFNTSEDIGGYLYVIAKHLWMKRAVKMNKNVSLDMSDLPPNLNNEVMEVYINKEKESALENVMKKVGEECQELFRLVMYERLSMKEICVRMKYSSESVAKTYHYRCKKRLAELVKKDPHCIELYKL